MRPHRHTARTAGLVAAAVLATVAATACSSLGSVVVTKTVTPAAQAGTDGGTTVGSTTADPSVSSSTSPSTTLAPNSAGTVAPTTSAGAATSTAPAQPVHVSTFEADGSTYGVGMAVMVLFSAQPTDASAFEKATTVTVNGQPATGAWFWQQPTVPGYKMEALYREKDYWPANSQIAVNMPVKGLSAGPGLVYDDSLTLDFAIGDAHISQVNNAQHRMTVTSNGKVVKNFPVSLGSATTPTYNGVKVVMEKGSTAPGSKTPLPNGEVRMVSDPGEPYYNLLVPWSVRITNSGEFIHAASWNTGNIGSRNTSHGCTNLDPGDAEWFYNFSLPGDVIEYPDANKAGTVQPSWDGWGWWNVSWSQWTNGGMLLPSA